MSIDFRDHETGKLNASLLFVQRLKDRGFTDEEILKIVIEFENICPYCFDGNRKCKCWNDE
jgi:hypothetical protein